MKNERTEVANEDGHDRPIAKLRGLIDPEFRDILVDSNIN